MGKVSPPLGTLRGHTAAVTALASCELDDITFLISGDQEGCIKVWDLAIFREHCVLEKLFKSRIQSLKILKSSAGLSYLIVQTRDEGVKLLDIKEMLRSNRNEIKHDYPAHEALFSRADAISLGDDKSFLAHPSSIENHLVTVRLLDASGATEISGSAQRFCENESKKCSIFDLQLLKLNDGTVSLFVAYEDGCLGLFSIDPRLTVEVPELRAIGLKIDLIKVFNFNFDDFLSAFDVKHIPESPERPAEQYKMVCGSARKNVIVASYSATLPNSEPDTKKLSMERPGVACIRIKPDSESFAVACWDSTVRLYSMEGYKELATLRNNMKQVQDILFVDQPSLPYDHHHGENNSSHASSGHGKYLLCCASQDGTISISSLN